MKKNNEIKIKILSFGMSKKSRKKLCKSDRKIINGIIQDGYYKL